MPFMDRFIQQPKLLLCVLLAILFSTSPLSAQNAWPDAGSVAEAMTRANNYWIANNSVGNSGWARSAYYRGNQRAARVLVNHAYVNWTFAWAATNQWQTGPEGYFNADSLCCGRTYLDLAGLNPAVAQLAPLTNCLNAWINSRSVSQLTWIDAFYMAGPVFAQMGYQTGNTNYYQQLWQMYSYMKDQLGLYDPATSLWYRDATYIYPAATNAAGGKVFWSRGNGWVFGGLARILQQMTTNTPHYQDYATMFQTMAPAIQSLQGSDGMWRPSLLDAAQYPTPETSGTAFFAYGIAWGIRSGLLPAATYSNTVTLAWHGMTNISLSPQGFLGYVQPPDSGPYFASPGWTSDYGVGAFLLACSEIELLATNGPAVGPWAGPNQTVTSTNASQTATVTLDGSQTEFYRGSAGPLTWWQGTNQIASGTNVAVTLSVGQNVIMLNVPGADGITYTDAVTVTVLPQTRTFTFTPPPAPIVPVLAMKFNFEDAGTTTTDTVSGIVLNLADATGAPADLHAPPGSGMAGLGRSLNLTGAAAQGGSGPFAWTTNNSSVNLGTITNFTLCLWIKPTASLQVSGYPRFFTLGMNGLVDHRTNNSIQLLSDGTLQNNMAIQAFVNTNQTDTSAYGAFNMPTNVWSYLALTYDGTNLNCYGGSETNVTTLISSASFPAGTIVLSNAWSLFLGNRLTQDRAFQGLMDDVRFYTGGVATPGFIENVRQAALAPPAALITSRVISGGTSMVLQAATVEGANYVLETTTSLTPPVVWTPLSTNAGTGSKITNTVPVSKSNPQQFFRYVAQ